MEEDIKEKETHESLTLFDYFIILMKRKVLILSITLSVALITYIFTLLFPAYFYIAETSLLPPQKQISVTNQFMSELGFPPRMIQNVQNAQDLLVEIIKSRTLTDRIIKRFDLVNYYGLKDVETARKRLLKNITIEPDFTDIKRLLPNTRRSPLTRIYALDFNAQRAADLANAVVDELKKFVTNIAISEASQRRLFFEEQLEKTSKALIKSEEEIRKFQEKTGILAVETQTKMVIEKIANLKAQIISKEVELEVMKSYSTVTNPDFQKVNETIKGLKKELAKLEAKEGTSKDLIIPSGTIPALGLEYNRLYRQLKYDETLYEILTKQYEIAKIDESKDAAMIQVIDKAVPPEKQYKVRTFGRKKALAYTLLAFFFSIFLALSLELYERSSQNEKYKERIETLKKYLYFRK
jgi:capsule polysaccharide export protein KpsE/RkpR